MSEQQTVIYGDRATQPEGAQVQRGGLWLNAAEFERISRWRLKPEGFCKDELCVPVPPARKAEFIDGDLQNLAALAGLLGQPVIHDAAHSLWCIGASSAERKRALTSLEAPDFTLPDIDGRMHSLSAHRGRKVLLASWASW